MMTQPLIYEPWFEHSEYEARLARVQTELKARGLDGLLAFQPETVTWLTGFFTRGYGSFQLAIIPVEGPPTLVCRDVEEYYLNATCVFPSRSMWTDSDEPVAVAAKAIQASLGATAKAGVETAAWPLTVARYEQLRDRLSGCWFTDESGLVREMRLIKSAAEIALQRLAGKAAESGMQAAIDSVGIGVSEREIAAEVCSAMIRAGSDLPGPGVMSSGDRAFHLHGGYSDRILKRGDIVQIETTPNVRHYHARFMRPIRVAEASDNDHKVVESLIAIQNAAMDEVRPGVPAAVPDAIYRDGILSQGLRETYTNKTFYSVGLLLQPSGGEALEATPGCEWHFETGMTFHTYLLAQGFGMSETIVITDTGYDRLTRFARQLFTV
ncbi:MAG: Xaa-Pro peptidase family protein [Paracoccaceae bacterium]|nr:Xaa-Pro peptidase family protein [Paracoccaceae bacterium]